MRVAFQKLSGQLDNRELHSIANLGGVLSFRPFAPEDTDLRLFNTITKAVAERRELQFRYRNYDDNRIIPRTVRPYHLTCYDNRWYLVGYYRGKFLNAVSVGFVPIRWEDPSSSSSSSSSSSVRRRYLEQELLEVSAVGIPANPNALALGLKSGALEKSDIKESYELLRQLCDVHPTRHTRIEKLIHQFHRILES